MKNTFLAALSEASNFVCGVTTDGAGEVIQTGREFCPTLRAATHTQMSSSFAGRALAKPMAKFDRAHATPKALSL